MGTNMLRKTGAGLAVWPLMALCSPWSTDPSALAKPAPLSVLQSCLLCFVLKFLHWINCFLAAFTPPFLFAPQLCSANCFLFIFFIFIHFMYQVCFCICSPLKNGDKRHCVTFAPCFVQVQAAKGWASMETEKPSH